MTDREDLRDRLRELENSFGFGPTAAVVVGAGGDEWPDDVAREDVEIRKVVADPADPIDEVHELAVPYHRPPEYRGGVVVMSPADVASVYAAMPDEVRERELEYRLDNGLPVPGVLTQ